MKSSIPKVIYMKIVDMGVYVNYSLKSWDMFSTDKKWRLNSRDGLCLITYVVSHAATVNKLLENTPEVENDVF